MAVRGSLASMPAVEYLGPARVLEINEETGRVQILLSSSETGREPCKTWARVAIPHPRKLAWGQTVLAAGRETDDFYILGVLGHCAASEADPVALANPQRDPAELFLHSGVRAEKVGSPEAEKLRVFSERDEILFEYDSRSGKARVCAPNGDLEVVSKDGSIDFVSAEGIRFFSKDPIEMRSLQGISLASATPRSPDYAALELGPDRIELKSPHLGIRTRKGDIRIQNARYQSERVSARMNQVSLVMDRLESVAGQVVQKAKNLYQTVKELSQLRTGRMRTLVDETYQFKSNRTFMKTQEDFKIKGDQIHLG